jgi:hypothetical protein
MSASGSGSLIGQAIVAADTRLKANGFSLSSP